MNNIVDELKDTLVEIQIMVCPKCGKTWEIKLSEFLRPGENCQHGVIVYCCKNRFSVDFFRYADGCRCEKKEGI